MGGEENADSLAESLGCEEKVAGGGVRFGRVCVVFNEGTQHL